MARSPGLKRLVKLYDLVERVRAVELHAAESSLDEVKRTRSTEESRQRDLIRDGRAALINGDGFEWMLALKGRSLIETRLRRILEQKLRFEEIRQKAAEAHRMSRLRLEQLQRVVERVQTASAIVEVRRTQALADDRYGARREWIRTKTVREA